MEAASVTLVNDIDYGVGIGAVADLLKRNGIEPAEVGQLHRVKDIRLWQGMAKVDKIREDGAKYQEMELIDQASVVLSPKWETGPDWPVIQPGPSVKLPTSTVKKASSGEWLKAAIWPDMQVGYFTDKSGELVSTHDEVAIDLALAVTKDLKPNLIVLVGDNLDLPEMGKYRLSPAFNRTTQHAIDYVTVLMGRIRAAAPDARIVWLAGNHEERLVNYLLDNAGAAFGLRQGSRPEGWPVLSVPHLCRLDEVAVEYIPGYPAGKFWINERLKVIHGTRVRSGGSTAHAYLANEKTSVLYGHIHRREWAEQTFDKWDGPKTIMAATPGCLAKTTGEVPSTKGGIDLHGRPLTVVEDWQQGIGVVTYEQTEDHRFFYEQVAFHGGTTLYAGKLYGNV
jgi:hypothetical protein